MNDHRCTLQRMTNGKAVHFAKEYARDLAARSGLRVPISSAFTGEKP